MTPPRGAFIVIEGLDRCGKTTQCARLVTRLREEGHAVVDTTWRYPDRSSATGQLISQVLSGSSPAPDPHALHLLFTANRWERDAHLRSLLLSGVTVVADRYAYSGVVYSVAAHGLPAPWARAAEAGLVAADAVILLRVDADAAAARAGYGSELYERTPLQRRVADAFHALVAPSWRVVDADAPVDAVSDRVWHAVDPALRAARHAPLRVLWDADPAAP